MTMKRIAATLMALLAFTACTPQEHEKAEDPAPAPRAVQSYDTLDEMRDDVVRAGMDCPRWLPLAGSPLIGEFAGSCSSYDNMTIYRSKAEIDEYMALAHDRGVPEFVLVGPNWTLDAPLKTLEMLSDQIGGKVYRP